LLQIEYGQTLLVDCWSVTPCWRWCHIWQARSDKQVVWWRIHCSVLSCICNDASAVLLELAGRDRFAKPLIVFYSHWFIKVHRRHRGYPAAYQPKGWCHRAGRSLPTSGKHLTNPCQFDDDPWHLQQ
jgi:hypothetical protein